MADETPNDNKNNDHAKIGPAQPDTGSDKKPPTPEGDGSSVQEELGCGTAVLGLPLRVWDTVAIILMTAAADLCLYSHPGGTGAAVLLLVTGMGLLSVTHAAPGSGAPLLMFTLLLIATASAWNHWWLLGLTGWLTVLGFAVKLRRPDWKITEIVCTALRTALMAPLRLTGHVFNCLGYAVKQKTGQIETKVRAPLRVIVVPLVVTVLFILIFIAANPVVEQLAREVSERLGDWLRDFWRLFEVPRMALWLFWLLVFAALVRPAVKSWIADRLVGQQEQLGPPRDQEADQSDYATALATLICVNVLFLAFNAMDLTYLFLKVSLPAGVSPDEYSHRGCFWLTMGLLLSTAVIGIVFWRRLNFHPRSRVLRALSYFWAAQNGVLAVVALRRIQIYVHYAGLTYLRIVGVYGVLLVVVGLVLMVVKVRRSRNLLWLIRRDMLAFWIAAVVLALTPIDYVCWRYNTPVVMSGNVGPLSNLYRQHLSPQSLPPLIPLLDHKEEWVREGIAGLLGRELDALRRSTPTQWTEWQGSHTWALARLEAVADKIEAITKPGNREKAEKALFERVHPYVDARPFQEQFFYKFYRRDFSD